MPRPDLTLLTHDPQFYSDRNPTPADVLLILEIGDHSLEHDRDLKLPLYVSTCLTEYWLVNLRTHRLEVYRDPSGDNYHTRLTVQPGNAFAPLAFPDAPLIVLPPDDG